MKVYSPAKINLFLEVLGRLSDGYHEIATLFAKVGLYDELEFHRIGRRCGVSLKIRNGTGIPLDDGPDNLVVRAADGFRREFGMSEGIRIRLVKRIPPGAGLGGGPRTREWRCAPCPGCTGCRLQPRAGFAVWLKVWGRMSLCLRETDRFISGGGGGRG